jgi:hypothetical protein
MFPQSHERDVATLMVPRIGCVAATDDPLEPYRLMDADRAVVAPVASFLRELLARVDPVGLALVGLARVR